MAKLTVLMTMLLCAFVAADVRCGGDGPRPLTDISPSTPVNTQEFATHGNVQQALFLDGRNQLIYRTREEEMRKISLDTGVDTFLSYLSAPLSRLVDPLEQYLLTEKNGILWNLSKNTGWESFLTKPLIHGFWKNGALYSLRPSTSGTPDSYRVIEYNSVTKQTVEKCRLDLRVMPDLRLAEGHSYPNFFFHGTTASGGPVSRLVLWKYDIERCDMQSIIFPEALEGNPMKVARFEELGATLARIDDSRSSLLWQTKNTCSYIDSEGDVVFPVRYDLPIVFLWSEANGLSVANLNLQNKVRILSDVDITALSGTDVNLSSDGRRAYVTPSAGVSRTKKLYEVNLDWKMR